MDLLNDVEAIAVAYVLQKRNKVAKKEKSKRRYWVHPINMKIIKEGQFQVNFMTLRAHPEEFFKYFRMSITSFDELISLVWRIPICTEERLTITLR
ncbi:unnamed protein product [Macrosiphum euphorbiae]|uniref:Protein ANTAGONIST OF LIKE HETEROCHROMATIN PROTEIN 1-like n=1 Tax=Macrosiphum euphorbiae TaxID=13131 RepID=A0AAV0VQQ4_9HEMI|nr:unnamed protein product [Macrosiphum euphorbiae]